MKRRLSAVGLGAAVVVAALSAACGTGSLSSSTAPPAPVVQFASEPTAVASPTPTVVVVSTPTLSPAPSTPAIARSNAPSKADAVPPSASCDEDHYVNVDGICVHRPASSSTVPAGASAVCRDGTYSFSLHRQGTCSHHGGVAEWL